MTLQHLPVVVALLLTPWALRAAEPLTLTDTNRHAVETVALPAWHEMALAAADLAKAIGTVCASPPRAKADPALAAYGRTFLAWQRARMVHLGPGFTGERPARLQFWPDQHGTAQRQLQMALAEADQTLLDPDRLNTASVALQGLPVVERLLVERVGMGNRGYGCALAHASARAHAQLSADIEAEWRAFAPAVLAAGEGGGPFLGPFDPAAAILRGLVDELDVIVAHKLERPLAKTAKTAKPRLAESWRTERSLEAIAINLETAERLVVGSETFTGLLVAVTNDAALAARLTANFADAGQLLARVTMPLERAVAVPAERARLAELAQKIKALRGMLATELGPALGVSVGFNALDGD